MMEDREEGRSCVNAALKGRRRGSARIMRPDAYVFFSLDLPGRPGERARDDALEELSRILPDGLEGFLVDARVARTKGGTSRATLVAIEEEAYLDASDRGKESVYAIESLLPKSGDAVWIASFGETALRIRYFRGRIVDRLLMGKGARFEPLSCPEGEPSFFLDLTDGKGEAVFPEGLRKPSRELSFRPFDARIGGRRRLAVAAAALLLPWIAASSLAALRGEAYRTRTNVMEKHYREFEGRAIAFAESEESVRELNAERMRNADLRRTLAACLEGFSAQGSRMLSFSYNGAGFNVSGRGGRPLEIMRRLSLEGTIRDLRLLETEGEERKAGSQNRFTIMGKYSG